jgi:hypothetical protein
MGDVIDGIWQHYAVAFGVAVSIVVLSLLWKAVSWGMTRAFSKHRLKGNWETMLDRSAGAGLVRHEDVTLKQFIHLVWGTSVDLTGRKYRLRGNLTGDRFRLVYSVKGVGTDGGAALLAVAVSGESMSGFEIGVDTVTNKIYANPYEWKRKP